MRWPEAPLQAFRRLTREVRVVLDSKRLGGNDPFAGGNAWAFQPGSLDVAPSVALQVSIKGPIDPVTGYICDIRILDRLVRDALKAWYESETPPANWVAWSIGFHQVLASQSDLLPANCSFESLEIGVTSQLSLRTGSQEPHVIELTRQFEFSASHRLHAPSLSAEVNQELFGKCNRPHGHGHNYVLAVTIRIPSNRIDRGPDPVEVLDEEIRTHVIDRLDHFHLNLDLPEFKNLNPTVENIVSVIRQWIHGKISVGDLAGIRLYETPKTWVDWVE